MIFNIPVGSSATTTFDVVVDGSTYHFLGTSGISVPNKFYIQVSSYNAWRMYVYPSVQLSVIVKTFDAGKPIDIGLVGKGGNGGGNGYYGNSACGGGGGGGGEIKAFYSRTLSVGTYAFNTSGSTYISGPSSFTCNNGGNGQRGQNNPNAAGGASGGNSGNGARGGYSGNGTGGENGSAGGYLFGASFDSTIYGAGAGGGHAYNYGDGGNGNGYGNPGSGGHGHGDNNSFWSDAGHDGWDGIIWIKSSDW